MITGHMIGAEDAFVADDVPSEIARQVREMLSKDECARQQFMAAMRKYEAGLLIGRHPCA